MAGTTPEPQDIRQAVKLACRAPSLHNSQPWRWVAEGEVLHLSANRERLVPTIDRSGREMMLSCGAVLDHLRVAMAAAGWDTGVERLPDADDPDHLATVDFSPMALVDDARQRRADAILRRRTDRLPFAAPTRWKTLEAQLRGAVDSEHVSLDVVSDEAREQLAEASRLTESIRRQDPTYQSELRWWTSPFQLDQGVPQNSRVSASEASRVDVARNFPTTGYGERRPQIEADHSKIVVLSTRDDSRGEVLRCGEALSTVLLECTIAGMATCTLTHMTEMAPSRNIIRRLIGRTGQPQLLVRVGTIPPEWRRSPATPRLPVTDVLEFHS
jgi:hypothetical protein